MASSFICSSEKAAGVGKSLLVLSRSKVIVQPELNNWSRERIKGSVENGPDAVRSSVPI